MEETRGLFRFLDGTPAHAMVVAGILLALLAPVIPQCTSANRDAAEADIERARMLYEMDLEELVEAQEAERKAEREAMAEAPDGESFEARRQREMEQEKKSREAEEARTKALEDAKKEYKDKHDINGKRRAAVNARVDAAGVKLHLFLHWLGRFFLVLGMLVMTVGARGTQQKILLVVLVLVLLGSLTGINLDVGARGSLGT